MRMQHIWKLERHLAWSGIVYSDQVAKQIGDFYIGCKRSKSDYLSIYGQFVS